MPCKACHPPRVKFEQGKKYTLSDNDFEDVYIAARITAFTYALINLSNGNCYQDPCQNLQDIAGNHARHFREMEDAKHAIS